MADDPREAAAEYLTQGRRRTDDSTRDTTSWTASDRAAYVESAIQQAMREGAFDNLPGAGNPLEDLGTHHDPDWWIKRKIQTEDIHGLGPVALTLRVEDRELTARLDALRTEQAVHEALDDFNRRVREARLQLLGGPPVVTPLRNVDSEVEAWHERRARRPASTETDQDAVPRRRRWFRRR